MDILFCVSLPWLDVVYFFLRVCVVVLSLLLICFVLSEDFISSASLRIKASITGMNFLMRKNIVRPTVATISMMERLLMLNVEPVLSVSTVIPASLERDEKMS